MGLRQRWKDTQRRKTLTLSIRSTYASEFKNCKTREDEQIAGEIARDITKYEQNELEWLEQKHLLNSARSAGIEIRPDDYDEGDGFMQYGIIGSKAESRIRREVKDLHLSRAKDWVAIVIPLLTSLIALLSLVVALRKK